MAFGRAGGMWSLVERRETDMLRWIYIAPVLAGKSRDPVQPG
jgi:hypothetical protein